MSVLQATDIRELRGLVATCVLTGTVDPDFAQAREDMRAWNVEHGFTRVEYRNFYCVLVEAGRDAVAEHALSEGYDWVLQIDADAAPFPQDALARLLARAYIDAPDAACVGAYAQLKDPPHLPTIDTGTGKWEVHYPGQGLLPVIRTGGHFLLTKCDTYRMIGAPFHRTRVAPTALDVMREFDTFARTRLNGRNVFADLPEWESLIATARGQAAPTSVGEDSAFCDRVTSRGGRIYVDTDIVAGHVRRQVITPDMLKQELEKQERMRRSCVGVYE